MPGDLDELDFAVREVDMVGYSFVQRAQDIVCLQDEMAMRRADWRRLGLIAKVETLGLFATCPRSWFRRPAGSPSA
jgi:pyruvate kinase